MLTREVAGGAYDFEKADFLFHLAEIRERTFRSQTIKSGWKKSEIWPINRSEPLDCIKDPVSSFTSNVDESTLAGYIEAPNTSLTLISRPDLTTTTPTTPVMSTASRTAATPPTARRFNWAEISTPAGNVARIQQCNDYVELRLTAWVESNVPVTPTVLHIQQKAQKVSKARIAASRELRRLQEKTLRRKERNEKWHVVAKYGPIRLDEARARAATDEYNRKAAKEAEMQRILRRTIKAEDGYWRRWVRKQPVVRSSFSCPLGRFAAH